jgi:crotonobetainyl-CoA:carnitine CoA-transferase CaiB-like acyl-CoA transferase
MGGLMSITGYPGHGPLRVGIPVADLTAGSFAAIGVLTALLERDKSGKGQAIETSLLQAQIFMLDFQAARYLVEGEVAGQAGNNHPTTIPTSAFKTRDGYINIATTGGKMWERFCQALGAPDMTQNPDYQTAGARLKHRDALNAEIETYLQKRDSADWVEHFNDAGVPCGPIYSIDKVFADPQVKHLNMAQKVGGKGKSKSKSKSNSKLTLVGQPISLSRTPSHLAAPPPALGEHTDAILKEFGFSKREIKALHKAGAV